METPLVYRDYSLNGDFCRNPSNLRLDDWEFLRLLGFHEPTDGRFSAQAAHRDISKMGRLKGAQGTYGV